MRRPSIQRKKVASSSVVERSKVATSKVSESRDNVLFGIESLVNGPSDNPDSRECLDNALNAFWCRNEVDKEDRGRGDARDNEFGNGLFG